MATVELGQDGNSVAELSSLNLDMLCFLGLVLYVPHIILDRHALCVFLPRSSFNFILLIEKHFGLILSSFVYFEV